MIEKPKKTFKVDTDAPPSKCRSCGAEVWWIRTFAGKMMPVNRDGTSHFSTCPQAAKWRKS